ncbi:MAG: hypothetical protein E7012_04535 [Alphaproteobacteria bacterium]|nr:hypothetical protein [Alphaproteobacteria bacterium]
MLTDKHPQYINDYVTTMQSIDEYEKIRNKTYQPSSNVTDAEKSQMINMVSDLRHKNSDFIKSYAQELDNNLKKGISPKLPTYNNQEVSVSDISFAIAESLQLMYAGESPLSEYYDWVKDQRQIEIEINTNGTTESEINDRNNFINFLDDRETELKLIISLYSTAERNGSGFHKEMAQQRLNFLYFKLSELRRLRERTQQTKSYSDEKEEKVIKTIEHTHDIAEQLVYTYVAQQNIANELDSAAERIQPQYMPVTKSITDVNNKKMQLYQNSLTMGQKIQELRGISNTHSNDIYTSPNMSHTRPRGFSMYEYRKLSQKELDKQ